MSDETDDDPGGDLSGPRITLSLHANPSAVPVLIVLVGFIAYALR